MFAQVKERKNFKKFGLSTGPLYTMCLIIQDFKERVLRL